MPAVLRKPRNPRFLGKYPKGTKGPKTKGPKGKRTKRTQGTKKLGVVIIHLFQRPAGM
jgi:hypothetical protein